MFWSPLKFSFPVYQSPSSVFLLSFSFILLFYKYCWLLPLCFLFSFFSHIPDYGFWIEFICLLLIPFRVFFSVNLRYFHLPFLYFSLLYFGSSCVTNHFEESWYLSFSHFLCLCAIICMSLSVAFSYGFIWWSYPATTLEGLISSTT